MFSALLIQIVSWIWILGLSVTSLWKTRYQGHLMLAEEFDETKQPGHIKEKGESILKCMDSWKLGCLLKRVIKNLTRHLNLQKKEVR